MTKLTVRSLSVVWNKVLVAVGEKWARQLKKAVPQVIPFGLVLRFKKNCPNARDYCRERSRLARLEKILEDITGLPWKVSVRGEGNELLPAKFSPPAYLIYQKQKAGLSINLGIYNNRGHGYRTYMGRQ